MLYARNHHSCSDEENPVGDVFGSFSPWAIPLATLGFVFQAWPIVMVSALRQTGLRIESLFGVWLALAIVRFVILFDPHPLWDALIWSDPVRTSAFVLVGMFLATAFVVRRIAHR